MDKRTHWVQVTAMVGEGQGDRYFRAGRAWFKDGKNLPPVEVTEAVLEELEADDRLKVKIVDEPDEHANEPPHDLPLRVTGVASDGDGGAQELATLRRDAAAFEKSARQEVGRLQKQVGKLEKENADLRAALDKATTPSGSPG